MKGLSKKEIEIISWLEFNKNYFFTTKDIDKFSKNKTQRYNIIKNLLKKKRIIKLNRTKYFLIPIHAKSGGWSEHPFVIIDEIFDGKNYFIGGVAAANYWKLIEQIPFEFDVYTTKRQGKTTIFNARIVFHRTTENRIKNAVKGKKYGHDFLIQSRNETKKWMKSRE